jgi:hypothetical protein
MKNPEIKACPFCGSPAQSVQSCSAAGWRVTCTNDDCLAHVQWTHSDEGAAIEDWNRRAGELKAVASKTVSAKAVGSSELLADVLRYRRGLGRYNYSRLPDDQRSITALEAWEELETRIENTLSKAGVKVS